MSPNRTPQQLDPEQVRQGTTLRTLRELRGIKVGEMAAALGISYAYLSNIEAGRKRLTQPLVAKAADYLKVSQLALVNPEQFTGNEVPA